MSNNAGRATVIPISGYMPETSEFTFKGVRYVFRELTVGENDMCREAATDPKTEAVDSRAMMRMMVVTACVEPADFNGDSLLTLGSKLYSHIIDVVNELNDPDAFLTDEERAKQGDEPGNA